MNKYGKRFQGEEDIGFPIMEETPTIGTGPVSDSEIYEMLMRMQERNKREQNALNRSPSGMDEMRDMNTMMPRSTPTPSPTPSPNMQRSPSGIFDDPIYNPASWAKILNEGTRALVDKNYRKPNPEKDIGPVSDPEMYNKMLQPKYDESGNLISPYSSKYEDRVMDYSNTPGLELEGMSNDTLRRLYDNQSRLPEQDEFISSEYAKELQPSKKFKKTKAKVKK